MMVFQMNDDHDCRDGSVGSNGDDGDVDDDIKSDTVAIEAQGYSSSLRSAWRTQPPPSDFSA